MPGVLSHMTPVDHTAITGIAVTLNSTTAITSAGLFTSAMNKRVITVTSSGIPAGTVFTYTDASNGTLSVAATASGARTASFGQRLVLLTQQQSSNPVLAALVDPSGIQSFALPSFTTGATGLVLVEFGMTIFASSAAADNFIKFGLVHADGSVVVPAIGATATTVASGSNGVNTSSFAGAGTLNVASTTGFDAAGVLQVATGGTLAAIKHTGVSGGNQFTGCTTLSGGGVLATGGSVVDGNYLGRRVNLQFAGTHIAVFRAHYSLSASTTYSDLSVAVANGNQIDGSGVATYTIEWGGGKGPVTCDIWDLAA